MFWQLPGEVRNQHTLCSCRVASTKLVTSLVTSSSYKFGAVHLSFGFCSTSNCQEAIIRSSQAVSTWSDHVTQTEPALTRQLMHMHNTVLGSPDHALKNVVNTSLQT